VSSLKDEKLIKLQTHTKTETRRLYSRVIGIFLPNIIKIDPYNFELYRFKDGAFFETQCIVAGNGDNLSPGVYSRHASVDEALGHQNFALIIFKDIVDVSYVHYGY